MTERPSWAGHQLPLPALRVTHRHNEVAHRSTPHATLHAFLCHVVPSAWNVLLVNKPQFKNPFLQEPSPDFLPPLLLHWLQEGGVLPLSLHSTQASSAATYHTLSHVCFILLPVGLLTALGSCLLLHSVPAAQEMVSKLFSLCAISTRCYL